MLNNNYVITMRTLAYIDDELAMSYFPQTGMSHLTKEEAQARTRELNAKAQANGWAVDFGWELN